MVLMHGLLLMQKLPNNLSYGWSRHKPFRQGKLLSHVEVLQQMD